MRMTPRLNLAKIRCMHSMQSMHDYSFDHREAGEYVAFIEHLNARDTAMIFSAKKQELATTFGHTDIIESLDPKSNLFESLSLLLAVYGAPCPDRPLERARRVMVRHRVLHIIRSSSPEVTDMLVNILDAYGAMV